MPSTMTDMGIPPMVRCHLEEVGPRATLASGLPDRVVLSVKVLAMKALFVQGVLLLHYNYYLS